MAKPIHIQSSPRGNRSASHSVAAHFIESYRAAHPGDTVDTLDLWQDESVAAASRKAAELAAHFWSDFHAEDDPMKRTWTIIGVGDVPRSFKWYQSLRGLSETAPAHDYFGQILDSDGTEFSLRDPDGYYVTISALSAV